MKKIKNSLNISEEEFVSQVRKGIEPAIEGLKSMQNKVDRDIIPPSMQELVTLVSERDLLMNQIYSSNSIRDSLDSILKKEVRIESLRKQFRERHPENIYYDNLFNKID